MLIDVDYISERVACSHLSDCTIRAGCLGGRGSLGGMLGLFLSIFLCHFFCLQAYLLGPSKACTGKAGRAFGVERRRQDDVNSRTEKPHRCLAKPEEIALVLTPGGGLELKAALHSPLAGRLDILLSEQANALLDGQACRSAGWPCMRLIVLGQPPLSPPAAKGLTLHADNR